MIVFPWPRKKKPDSHGTLPFICYENICNVMEGLKVKKAFSIRRQTLLLLILVQYFCCRRHPEKKGRKEGDEKGTHPERCVCVVCICIYKLNK